MPWPEILGHERQLDLLERALGRHRVPPTLLFAGPSGVGKRRLAISLAKRLLCGAESSQPCGRCHHCSLIGHSLADLGRRRDEALEDKENPVGLNLRLHPDLILVEAWPSGGKRTIKEHVSKSSGQAGYTVVLENGVIYYSPLTGAKALLGEAFTELAIAPAVIRSPSRSPTARSIRVRNARSECREIFTGP